MEHCCRFECDHGVLAKKQVHVAKKWYPLNEYQKLKPLECRKLFIQQKANGVQKPPVCSVAAVSVDNASEISALTTVVSTLQTSVDALIGVSTKKNHRIAKIKKLQEDANMFADSSNISSNKDDTMPKASALALGRNKLAGGKKRKKN